MFSCASPVKVIVCDTLVVTFACFCTFVRIGPRRITRGLGGRNNCVPNVHPKGGARRCLAHILCHLALINTLFLAIVSVLPMFFVGVTKLPRSTRVKNADLLVIINITLRAVGRLRTRLIGHRCGNFVGWFKYERHLIPLCRLRAEKGLA